MKAPALTIDRKNKTITIVMALEPARPSKATGKTMVIGSTKGLRTSAEQFARRPVCFTANVIYFQGQASKFGRRRCGLTGRTTTVASKGVWEKGFWIVHQIQKGEVMNTKHQRSEETINKAHSRTTIRKPHRRGPVLGTGIRAKEPCGIAVLKSGWKN
jgi:hypothetical protein